MFPDDVGYYGRIMCECSNKRKHLVFWVDSGDFAYYIDNRRTGTVSPERSDSKSSQKLCMPYRFSGLELIEPHTAVEAFLG